MVKLREATYDDKFGDVLIVYGVEIDKNTPLEKKYEEKYVFYFKNKKYIGSYIDFTKKIGDILYYNYDNDWFISSIHAILKETKIKPMKSLCYDNFLLKLATFE